MYGFDEDSERNRRKPLPRNAHCRSYCCPVAVTVSPRSFSRSATGRADRQLINMIIRLSILLVFNSHVGKKKHEHKNNGSLYIIPTNWTTVQCWNHLRYSTMNMPRFRQLFLNRHKCSIESIVLSQRKPTLTFIPVSCTNNRVSFIRKPLSTGKCKSEWFIPWSKLCRDIGSSVDKYSIDN